MRTSTVSIFTARRIASAVVVTGVLAGLLIVAAPAAAQTVPTTGICNGANNQLAHRGNVQPNLLRAAARQNAELIATLQAERAALVTMENTPTAQITAAEKELAALDAQYATLLGQVDIVTMSLSKLESGQGHAHRRDRRRERRADDAEGPAHRSGQPDHAAADGAVRRADRAGRPRPPGDPGPRRQDDRGA